jgi:RimJ/RimL family protein N-acetyltransferase
MRLSTARLLLHPITPPDAQRIVDGAPTGNDLWHPDYPFADELGPLRSLARATAPDPVFTLYAIGDAATGLAIGGIGFFGPPNETGEVEVGYGLVADARGRGLAREALLAITDLARAHGARAITADTDIRNLASQRTLMGAGFAEYHRTNETVFFRRATATAD